MSDLIPKGQGAQRNVINRFDRYTFEPEDYEMDKIKTQVTEVFPKSIINVIKSPDLPMDYSMNLFLLFCKTNSRVLGLQRRC